MVDRAALMLYHMEHIPRWRSSMHCVQAKVDCWHVSVSAGTEAYVENLSNMTLAELHEVKHTEDVRDNLGIRRLRFANTQTSTETQ